MYKTLVTNRLSWFRTEHKFLNFTEISNRQDYEKAISNRDSSSPMVMLGNGSNCLFARKKVKSFVVKNKLPKEYTWQGEDTLWVSSSVPLMLVLKECSKKSLDSFYYLSSVPATVGGAIAMNAGRGPRHNKTIFDFVTHVDIWTPDGPISLKKEEIERGYRHTAFLDHPDWFIAGVLFEFPAQPEPFAVNPIAERVKYSQEVQDHSGPNCGSVFKSFDRRILGRLRGIGCLGAVFSRKTTNWITNRSSSTLGIRLLIRFASLLHFVLRKKCEIEIRIVE